MGIRGLNKIIKQYANESLSEHNISEFCGSKIAIDSEILIYKFKAKENANSNNAHIHGFINNVFWYLRNGIIPVYIFDGAPSIAKRKNALSKRAIQKEKMYKKVEELEELFSSQLENIENHTHDVDLGSDSSTSALSPEMNETLDQLLKLKRRLTSMTVTKNHKHECRYLLKLMGIPFINAIEDAEALCVALQHEKLVDYIYTEDTDAMTYAAGRLSGDIKSTAKIFRKGSTQDTVSVVDLGTVLRDMELTPDEFIDMCIMSGCDFCTGIPKIGPMKSYNYIKKYGSIEKFFEETKIPVPEGFLYQVARDMFKRDHSQELTKSLELGSLNINDLKTYLINERNLNPTPIITRYKSQIKVFKSKISQTTLDSFFKVIKTSVYQEQDQKTKAQAPI